MCAYYRAPDCDAVTIADVLPILSKIDYYEDEYVIGEMLIWDTGTQSAEPNNCAMVRVIVYNDGWICAWFDKTTQNQLGASGLAYVSAQELSGFGSTLEYVNRYNGCQLKITGSTDPDCPVDTVFCIRDTQHGTGEVLVHNNLAQTECFHVGYTYTTEIYMSNANLVWWGRDSYGATVPTYNSNRLYRAIYQIWEEIKDSSNSSNSTNGNTSLVYRYNLDDDSYTNVTTDFNDVDANDCQVFPSDEEVNDAFYIGYTYKYAGISITMGTMGVGNGVTWEYWDGTNWVALSPTDGTVGFTTDGEITFNPPDDWNNVNLVIGNYYWVRARVTTASYTTTPVITQGQVYQQDSIGYTETEFGVYNFEFTGANYVALVGNPVEALGNTTVEEWFYTTVLPGKTIYDTTMVAAHYSATSGEVEIHVNGALMFSSTNSTDRTGYVAISLGDVINGVCIQNSFKVYNHGSIASADVCYSSCGVVTIVS